MTGQVVVSDEQATRVVTLRRPEKRNAVTGEMYRAMSAAVDGAQDDPNIRCLVITGGPDVFTAGNDLGDFLGDGTQPDPPQPIDALRFLHSLARSNKPLVAAVDGIAVGIGTTLLFHCDYVVAGETATFSAPFIQLGLVPEGASTLLVPRAIGHQRAFALLVLGRTVGADDARVAGFVNQVVAPGTADIEARKVAREICALPAEAVAISRQLLKPSVDEVTRRIDHEGQLFGERLRSKEAVAALRTFFARKKA